MSEHPTKPAGITLREVERGEILRYLREFYPGATTPRAVLHYLDVVGYSMSPADLEFHLAYLSDKGFALLEAEDKTVGVKAGVRLVKISAPGLDYLDRRRAGDTGVRL